MGHKVILVVFLLVVCSNNVAVLTILNTLPLFTVCDLKSPLLALVTYYAQQGLCNCCTSVHPSVLSGNHMQLLLKVCCCGPGGQEILINCYGLAVHWGTRLNADLFFISDMAINNSNKCVNI